MNYESRSSAVCKKCWKKMSGYMPYFGFSCDGCIEFYEMIAYEC